MIRPCLHAVQCAEDPEEPIGTYESSDTSPAGGLCAEAIACAGVDDPFPNYSSEFDDDADFFRDLFECACVGDEYLIRIRAPGFVPPFTWTFVGDIPDGLVMNENVPNNGDLTINGGFLAPGHYEFTIQVTDGWGNLYEKDCVFNILEIVTLDLPLPVIGTPYNFQMEATGGSGNYAWKIVSGWLPDGLFLNTSGLIEGTPTSDVTVPVRFQVVDLSCVFVLDETYTPTPHIAMVGRSVTTIATTCGFDEFTPSGIIPTPRYKRLDWSGFSRQNFAFNVNGKPSLQVIGDIGIDYTGDSTINEDCSTGDLRQADGGTPCASSPFGVPAGRCTGPGLTFWHGEFGGVNSRDWRWQFMYADWPPTSITPTTSTTTRFGATFDSTISGGQVASGIANYNHDFSRTLSDEYTEADALANAVTATSDALVATNFPRTTGFISQYTSCEYDLVCTNLMLNRAYVVTVNLISSNGTVTPRTYNFTTGTDEATDKTHTITDTIPTPAAGFFTLVSNPEIDFA